MGGIRNLPIKALALSQNGVTQIGEDIFYVTSRTKPRITGHVIFKGKNGLYTCPCQSYAETNLCSHALAALFFESARNVRKNVLTENESIIKPLGRRGLTLSSTEVGRFFPHSASCIPRTLWLLRGEVSAIRIYGLAGRSLPTFGLCLMQSGSPPYRKRTSGSLGVGFTHAFATFDGDAYSPSILPKKGCELWNISLTPFIPRLKS